MHTPATRNRGTVTSLTLSVVARELASLEIRLVLLLPILPVAVIFVALDGLRFRSAAAGR